MTEDALQTQASDLNPIPVRNFDFAFPEDLNPSWIPHNPYRAHFYNGISLTMPYLEPFLCKTMREAQALVKKRNIIDVTVD